MLNAIKFEMMYQGRMLSSEIVEAVHNADDEDFDRQEYLKNLDNCRFTVGYYDNNRHPIVTKLKSFDRFDKDFFIRDGKGYSVVEDSSAHLGVRYVVLMESELSNALFKLRVRIISYLIFSFIVMSMVGYFLGKLFLQPVREQIESLDRFISDTTHELNTPISAILMTIQSLKGIEPKKLDRLKASAKRLSMMYSSLTYRLEGKEESDEVFDIAGVVAERVEFMKELIESKRLRVTLDLQSYSMMISKSSLYRLLDNLLSNAVKYSNVGDEIEIKLKGNKLSISDTGIGIAASKQQDIFKRYLRANKERGGFGIGLSIVRSVCEDYHIGIALQSIEGKGSTFILTLPSQF